MVGSHAKHRPRNGLCQNNRRACAAAVKPAPSPAAGRRPKKAAPGQPAAATPGSPSAPTDPAVGASPQVGLSALVHLRSGVLWAWRLGRGAINERLHLKALLPTLPRGALVVADCGYQGYDMAVALMTANVAMLLRVSSLAPVYAVGVAQEGLDAAAQREWVDGLVW